MHTPVLLKEIIDSLNLEEGFSGTIVDATFGDGGHSVEIIKRYPNIKIIALDQDEDIWRNFKKNFPEYEKNVSFHAVNFRFLDQVLDKSIDNIDGIIFDLGLRSGQIENSNRGFSFQNNEPLLMTWKPNPTDEDLTAIDIVNTWSEESLSTIIYGYGEERFAKKIAKEIVLSRSTAPIKTTFDLLKIIDKALPGWYKKNQKNRTIHWATKTFQALRITVNDELNALRVGLTKGFDALRENGRMFVISFHSLEDRIVKNFYKDKFKNKLATLINKKPIVASSAELKNNPRSRSAKLRILEKII